MTESLKACWNGVRGAVPRWNLKREIGRTAVASAIKVDFIVGERDRRPDAMERAYRALKSRVEEHVDAREIHYRLPGGIEQKMLVKYPARASVYALKAKVKKRKGSIAHLHNQKLGYLLHVVDLSPCVAFCHDAIEYVLPEYRSPVIYRTFVKPYHTGTAKADLIVTPSRHTADEMKRLFRVPEERLRVIPNGVDHSVFRPVDSGAFRAKHGIPTDRPYVLNVGSEQPRKDVPTAVRAFLRARKEVPGLMFVKIGRADELPGHPQREVSLKLLKDAGAEHATKFIDWVPETLLPGAYSGAAALLFPTKYEGFGFPVVEAMACGTPVVTTNSSSIPEVAGEAAVMRPLGDDVGMAEAVVRLIRDEDDRQQRIALGISQSSRFDWDRSAASLLECYRSLVEKR